MSVSSVCKYIVTFFKKIFGSNHYKSASVYLRNGKIIIGTFHLTTDGIGIDSGLYSILSEQTDSEELGKYVIEALSKSKSNIPDPATLNNLTKPLQKAAGVNSYKAFVNGAILCSVTLNDNYIFTPSKNDGSNGFSYIPEKEISIPGDAAPSDVGNAVLAGLKKCE